MLAIVLGFKEPRSTSPFQVIYAGRSASAARDIADNPPAGFVRTESLSNPVTHHRRHFPGNEGAVVEADITPAADQEAEILRLTAELADKEKDHAETVGNFDKSWDELTKEHEALKAKAAADAEELARLKAEQAAVKPLDTAAPAEEAAQANLLSPETGTAKESRKK
jgi:hypothetical protein